jgi:hypothetical protein
MPLAHILLRVLYQAKISSEGKGKDLEAYDDLLAGRAKHTE